MKAMPETQKISLTKTNLSVVLTTRDPPLERKVYFRPEPNQSRAYPTQLGMKLQVDQILINRNVIVN